MVLEQMTQKAQQASLQINQAIRLELLLLIMEI
nr:MAG TPA: hypothetical protein [Bacteriophage sp.]